MAKIIPTGANFFVLLGLLLDLDIYVRIMPLRVVAGKPCSANNPHFALQTFVLKSANCLRPTAKGYLIREFRNSRDLL